MWPPGTSLSFLERQVLSSRNVAPNPVWDFVFGGLNYQVEHHLFPTMPRVNFGARETARQAVLRRPGSALRGDGRLRLLPPGDRRTPPRRSRGVGARRGLKRVEIEKAGAIARRGQSRGRQRQRGARLGAGGAPRCPPVASRIGSASPARASATRASLRRRRQSGLRAGGGRGRRRHGVRGGQRSRAHRNGSRHRPDRHGQRRQPQSRHPERADRRGTSGAHRAHPGDRPW